MNQYIYNDDQNESENSDFIIKDSNGTPLADGDSVQLIKDLKVKGSSINLKRGQVFKNIKITGDPEHVDCKVGKSTIMIKVEFLKKR